MTTETDLRAALHARACDAPTVDAEHLLATVAPAGPALRSTAGTSQGRRWAIAGVAAGFVALAAVGASLVAGGSAGSDAVAPAAPVSSPVLADTAPPPGTPTTLYPTPTTPANPYDANAPVPAAADWQNYEGLDNPTPLDDSAIVFTDQDPIVAFYVRPHQQLSVLAAGATQKDNSDALWHAAVQIYLPGSGFDPSTLVNPTSVTVDGIARQFGTLPRLLDVDAPAQIPSLLWQVGDDWVVLQIDNPSSATSAQLAAAAARMDVHHG